MRSFSNDNGPGSEGQASPATVTVTGARLGAGDTHWARMP